MKASILESKLAASVFYCLDPSDTMHSITCVLYSPEGQDLGEIPEAALDRIRRALDNVIVGEVVQSPIGLTFLVIYYGAYRKPRLEYGAAIAAYELAKMCGQHVDLLRTQEELVTARYSRHSVVV